MRKMTIGMDIEEGKKILIEVEEDESQNEIENNMVRVQRPEYIRRKRDFGETMEILKPIAEKIISPLRKLSDQPDNIKVEFKFKFNNHSEMILTTSDTQANIKVSLSWNEKKG